MGRYLWVLLVVAGQGLLFGEERSSPSREDRRAAFAGAGFEKTRDLLRGAGVPFDPAILLSPTWPKQLKAVLDAMPELQQDREELSGRLQGVYLARTLVLPEKVVAEGDVVILARRVVFLGNDAMIAAPGHSVAVFAIERKLHATRDEQPGKPRLSIFTGSLSNLERQLEAEGGAWEDILGPVSLTTPGPDGRHGADGFPGEGGVDGAAGSNGRNGGCSGGRDGEAGGDGEWGNNGQNGGNGSPGENGGNAERIDYHVNDPWDTGEYVLDATGGRGGNGGSGGVGGSGGSGGPGGRGGNGASCNDCSPGNGGNGGGGGHGGRGGNGGNASNGGNGGNGGYVAASGCRATFVIRNAGGEGGQAGSQGQGGHWGFPAPAGDGGHGGLGCGFSGATGARGQDGTGGHWGNHGNGSFGGSAGQQAQSDVVRPDGCDGGGGGGGGGDDCDESDQDACLSEPTCHWIYSTCECWCPSERPVGPSMSRR